MLLGKETGLEGLKKLLWKIQVEEGRAMGYLVSLIFQETHCPCGLACPDLLFSALI